MMTCSYHFQTKDSSMERSITKQPQTTGICRHVSSNMAAVVRFRSEKKVSADMVVDRYKKIDTKKEQPIGALPSLGA